MAGCSAGTKASSTRLGRHQPSPAGEIHVVGLGGTTVTVTIYLSELFKTDSGTAEVSQTALQQ